MLLFADSHHGGLTRSLFLLFHERLNHEIYFPNPDFVNWSVEHSKLGVWLPATENHFENLQGVSQRYIDHFPYSINREEFLSKDWDAIIITRCESLPLFEKLLQDHTKKDIKIIAQAGNEKTIYDWNWVKNFMSSDYGSYMQSGAANRIFYSQELGHQYNTEDFVPIQAEHLKTVVTFTNCLASFSSWNWDKDAWSWGGVCPHCDNCHTSQSDNISVFDLWNGMKEKMPECQFKDYGINNSQGMLAEKDMPDAYLNSTCGYFFKTYEGYGHSLLQSISLGRIAIIPRRFFQYRTAKQYLLPFRTCLECDWTVDSLVSNIRLLTDNIHRANDMSYACWQTAKGLFNWEYEASRVKIFLENLQ